MLRRPRRGTEGAPDPERLAELERQLQWLTEQNHRLVQESGPLFQENATLRYQLTKCQRDRQVLEYHLQSAVTEASAALRMLSKLDQRVSGWEILRDDTLAFCREAELLGVPGLGELADLAGEAWEASRFVPWTLDSGRWAARRATSLLASAARLRQRALAEDRAAADTLGAEPPLFTRIEERLLALQAAWGSGPAQP